MDHHKIWNSCGVMSWAKICCNRTARSIWIVMGKSLVKQATDSHDGTPSTFMWFLLIWREGTCRFYLLVTSLGMSLNNIMVTSSDGIIFWVTGPLWGESTAHRWIPLTQASDVSLICALINSWANNRECSDLRCSCTHYDVTVMMKWIVWYWSSHYHYQAPYQHIRIWTKWLTFWRQNFQIHLRRILVFAIKCHRSSQGFKWQ